MNMLFLISGPSGSGKNSIIEDMLKKNDALVMVPSCTSRRKRENEYQGNPYFFMSREDFEQHIETHQFLEWKIIHQHHYYGIRQHDIQQLFHQRKAIIKDIDILGSFDLRNHFPNQVIPIFINTQSKQHLISRLQHRKESESNIQQRLKRYDIEILYKAHFLHEIQNIELEHACEQLDQIIQGYLSGKQHPDLSKLYKRIFLTIQNTQGQVLHIQSEQSMPSTIIQEYQLHTETVSDATIRRLKFLFYPLEIVLSKAKIIKHSQHLDCPHYLVQANIQFQTSNIFDTENFKLQWMNNQ